MRYFLSGGSKSGKSMLGQRLARDMAAGGPLYYIATMIPRDEEDPGPHPPPSAGAGGLGLYDR